jgi:hypothetical protein
MAVGDHTLYRLPVFEKNVFKIHICALHISTCRYNDDERHFARSWMTISLDVANVKEHSQGHADNNDTLQDGQPEDAAFGR